MVCPYRRSNVEGRLTANHSWAGNNGSANGHFISELKIPALGYKFDFDAAEWGSKMRSLMIGLVSPVIKYVRLRYSSSYPGSC